MPDRGSFRISVFPADDAALRRDLDRALVEFDPNPRDPRDLRAVEEHLRQWYRSLQIRPRIALGGYTDDMATVWYVYRDGRILPRSAEVERFEDEGAAVRATDRPTRRPDDSENRDGAGADRASTAAVSGPRRDRR